VRDGKRRETKRNGERLRDTVRENEEMEKRRARSLKDFMSVSSFLLPVTAFPARAPLAASRRIIFHLRASRKTSILRSASFKRGKKKLENIERATSFNLGVVGFFSRKDVK